MRSDRQTNEGLYYSKMLTSWKKKGCVTLSDDRRQKRQNSCIPCLVLDWILTEGRNAYVRNIMVSHEKSGIRKAD